MNKNNKSGQTGVYYDAKAAKWRAQISIWGKKVKLGSFQTKQEAVNARATARKEYNLLNYHVMPLDLAIAHFVMQHEFKMKKSDLSYKILYDTFAVPSLLYAFATYSEPKSFIPYAVKLVAKDLRERQVRSVNNIFIQQQYIDPEDIQILVKFLSGVSIPKIAKKHALSYSTAYRRIQGLRIKIAQVEEKIE